MSSEFEVLEKLRRKFSLEKIGDDCAVLPKDSKTDLVITADMLVEDIDFHMTWAKPEFIGHKALAVSLSDIAAMGANPTWAMLSIAVPEGLWDTKFIEKFYAGWHKLAKKYKVELVGGDISRSPDNFVIDSIVAGEVPKGAAILRSTAKPGDGIFVTGELGGAAAGLKILDEWGWYNPDLPEEKLKLIEKQVKPTPEVLIGKLLQNNSIATAMIDISDGLSSDLHHLCRASGVGAKIYARKLPVDRNLKAVIKSPAERLELALNGGEDFELLFTAPKKYFSLLESTRFWRIGEITPNIGVIELTVRGETRVLAPQGYRHF
jgi:thiamine-monophosphate kinase